MEIQAIICDNIDETQCEPDLVGAMKMSKAKELWIREGSYEGDVWKDNPFYSVVSDSPDEIKDPIHVIEFKAYEEMKEALNKARIRLEICLGRMRGCDKDHAVSMIEIPGWLEEMEYQKQKEVK